MQAIAAKNGNMQEVDGAKVFPVLNMLNTKYFILPLQGGATMPLQNIYAQGNGWFVDKINYVADANAEYSGVGKIDVRHEAVADKKFEAALGQAKANDSTAIVKLDKYEPNNLQYTVNFKEWVVLSFFSEIYYPVGQPLSMVSLQSSDVLTSILRAVSVKPGKHTVVLDFHPTSISTTETIAYIAIVILLLAIAGAGYMEWRKK